MNNPHLININLSNDVTKRTCGHILVEIIKFIAYQKQQLPYPYERLKFIVNRKRNSNKESNNKETIQSFKHFNVVSTALDNLDCIFKNLINRIEGANTPQEVSIMLGPTLDSCREAYRVVLPTWFHDVKCHSDHINIGQKIGMNVLRSLATSQELGEMVYSTLAPTNMFIILKQKATTKQNMQLETFFNHCKDVKIPRKSHLAIINLKSTSDSRKCCNSLKVFGDDFVDEMISEEHCEQDYSLFESTNNYRWLQSSLIVKGFKDSLVNGKSVTNSWIS